MRLQLFKKGLKFSVWVLVLDDGSCPATDFMQRLKQDDRASHRSLVNVLLRHADYGPIMNTRKSRAIEGRVNLFEFKSSQGARLLYFYLPGRRTVLAHGFQKGARASIEYDRAESMKENRPEGNEP